MRAARRQRLFTFLEESGYVLRSPGPGDPRRARLAVTDRGHSLMREGEAVFDELRAQWESQVGRDRISDLQDALLRLLGPGDATLSGWNDMTSLAVLRGTPGA